MNEEKLAKEIGDFFGKYFEEDQLYCIDNGENVFQYESPQELLSDWVDTLICHQHDTEGDPSGNWEDEIIFIHESVMKKWPVGIRPYYGKAGYAWKSSVDVTIPEETGLHGKNLFLGTYPTIVDAIYARKEFAEFQKAHEGCNLQTLQEEAARMRNEAYLLRKTDRAEHKVGQGMGMSM